MRRKSSGHKTIAANIAGIKYKFRSLLEKFFAYEFAKQGKKFLYESKKFRLENGTKYTPDFYLVDENLYIEIKPYGTDKDWPKIEQLRNLGINIELRIAKDLQDYFNYVQACHYLPAPDLNNLAKIARSPKEYTYWGNTLLPAEQQNLNYVRAMFEDVT